ncbi:MAG: DUF4292 domain-containing protein [Ignavibacteriaceae bacterium]
MKKYLIAILMLINFGGILFFNGCAPTKQVAKVEILSAERLVDKLEVNRRRIRTFEGTGTLVINSEGIENRASFKITLAKPDSIELSIMGPFGIELGEALVTKKNYVFYDALQNTAYEGEVNEDILKNIFRIDLPFSDLMNAFLGAVNLTNHLYKMPTKYSVDGDKYVLTYIDSVDQQTEVYLVDIRQLGITNYDVTNLSGDLLFTGRYTDFDLLENVAVPYSVNIIDKQNDQTLSIKYKKITANRPYIHINFNIPADANIIKW